MSELGLQCLRRVLGLIQYARVSYRQEQREGSETFTVLSVYQLCFFRCCLSFIMRTRSIFKKQKLSDKDYLMIFFVYFRPKLWQFSLTKSHPLYVKPCAGMISNFTAVCALLRTIASFRHLDIPQYKMWNGCRVRRYYLLTLKMTMKKW